MSQNKHGRGAVKLAGAGAGAGAGATRSQGKGRQWGGFAMGLVAGLLMGLALALGVALYITKAPVPFINKVPQRTVEQDNAETERNRNWDPNAPLGGKSAARPLDPAAAPVEGMASGAGAVAGAPTGPAAGQGLPLPLPPGNSGNSGSSGPGTPTPVIATARDPAAILAGATTTPVPGSAAAPGVSAFPSAGGPPAAGVAQPVAPTTAAITISDPFVYFVQAGAFNRGEEAEQQRAKLALMGQSARITEREQAGRTVYRVRLGPFATRDEADVLQLQMQQQGIGVQIVRVEKP